MHSFASLHLAFHHQLMNQNSEGGPATSLSGSELDVLQNYFPWHRHEKSAIEYSGVGLPESESQLPRISWVVWIKSPKLHEP